MTGTLIVTVRRTGRRSSYPQDYLRGTECTSNRASKDKAPGYYLEINRSHEL